eukprot:TRINITY_DN4535_c1_g1_i1.p5 TRINITY_DN4535_c1_g1~~TRINITY_DN4535_c1_g1_i1.p5  ORF type:complete len:105 (-),score=15.97 TRINITY_DN4535_c1_g1_i1:526-840(-)
MQSSPDHGRWLAAASVAIAAALRQQQMRSPLALARARLGQRPAPPNPSRGLLIARKDGDKETVCLVFLFIRAQARARHGRRHARHVRPRRRHASFSAASTEHVE